MTEFLSFELTQTHTHTQITFSTSFYFIFVFIELLLSLYLSSCWCTVFPLSTLKSWIWDDVFDLWSEQKNVFFFQFVFWIKIEEKIEYFSQCFLRFIFRRIKSIVILIYDYIWQIWSKLPPIYVAPCNILDFTFNLSSHIRMHKHVSRIKKSWNLLIFSSSLSIQRNSVLNYTRAIHVTLLSNVRSDAHMGFYSIAISCKFKCLFIRIIFHIRLMRSKWQIYGLYLNYVFLYLWLCSFFKRSISFLHGYCSCIWLFDIELNVHKFYWYPYSDLNNSN